MKRKGFTLVELLAVIVILSILLLIGAPTLINNLNEKKQEASNKVEELIISAARNYVIDYNLEEPLSLPIETLCGYIDCPVIDPYKNEEINGYVIADEERNYSIVNYKVGFNVELNGGSSGQTFETEYPAYTTLTIEEPIKAGYGFSHWEITKGNGIVDGNKVTVGSTDTEIYAMWVTKPKFDIDYDGGTVSNPDLETSYKTGTSIDLVPSTKEGYTFSHWEIVEGNSTRSGNVITIGTENTVVKAIWKVKTVMLTVNTRPGLTAKAINGSVIKTAVANSSGKAVFNEIEIGTWTLSVTDGTEVSDSLVVELKDDKTVELDFFKAYITVTYPHGTCTVTRGDKTYTHSGGGTATFMVEEVGTYNVQIKNGSISKTGTATVTTNKETVSLTLNYDKYYILDGTPSSGFAWSKISSSGYAGQTPSTNVSQSSGFLKLTVSYIWEGYPAEATFATAGTVNAYGYKKLYIKVNNVTQTVKLTFAGKTITLSTTSSESISSIDLSSITEDTISNVQLFIATGGSSQGKCQIMQMWLE